MKTKVFTGKADKIEADLNEFISNSENFQLHSAQSSPGANGEIIVIVFFTGEEPKKGKK